VKLTEPPLVNWQFPWTVALTVTLVVSAATTPAIAINAMAAPNTITRFMSPPSRPPGLTRNGLVYQRISDDVSRSNGRAGTSESYILLKIQVVKQNRRETANGHFVKIEK
jgi:hypothetical protein